MTTESDTMDAPFNPRQLEYLDRRFDGVDRRFEAVDRRFEAIDHRFDAVDRRFDALDQRFDALERSIDRRFDKHLEEVSIALGVLAEQMIAKMDARLDARTKATLEDLDRRNQAANEQIDVRVTRIEAERLPERVAALEAKAAPPPTKQPARRRRG